MHNHYLPYPSFPCQSLKNKWLDVLSLGLQLQESGVHLIHILISQKIVITVSPACLRSRVTMVSYQPALLGIFSQECRIPK